MEYLAQALDIIAIAFLINKITIFMLFILFSTFSICSLIKIVKKKIKRYPLKS
jgi:hypothetical protein